MSFKKLIYVLVTVTLLYNCSGGSDDNTPEPDPIPETVTYNGHVKAIMTSNCLACHGNPPTNGAPKSFTTYDLVKAGVEENILFRINSASDPMPPTGRMNSNNRAIIQKWKDQGFLEN